MVSHAYLLKAQPAPILILFINQRTSDSERKWLTYKYVQLSWWIQTKTALTEEHCLPETRNACVCGEALASVCSQCSYLEDEWSGRGAEYRRRFCLPFVCHGHIPWCLPRITHWRFIALTQNLVIWVTSLSPMIVHYTVQLCCFL